MKKLKLLLPIIILGFFSFGQGTLIKVNNYNTYVSTPSDYSTSGKTYPTIIYYPGLGEIGTTASLAYKYGVSAYVRQVGSVEASGVKFIAITVQPSSAYPSEATLNTVLSSLISLYRIDTTNIFLTGYSHGGWCASTFVSEGSYHKRIKAIATYGGVLANDNKGFPNSFDAYALNNGKFLCVENYADIRYMEQATKRMNVVKPGTGFYVVARFGDGSHTCCPDQMFGGNGSQPQPIIDGLNLYQWFAKQVTTSTTPPIVTPPPTTITYSQNYVDSITKRYTDQLASKDKQISTLNESIVVLTSQLNSANTNYEEIKNRLNAVQSIICEYANKKSTGLRTTEGIYLGHTSPDNILYNAGPSTPVKIGQLISEK